MSTGATPGSSDSGYPNNNTKNCINEINEKSKNTIITYGSHLKKANEWKPLEKWTKDNLNAYILQIKKTKKTSGFEHTKLVSTIQYLT